MIKNTEDTAARILYRLFSDTQSDELSSKEIIPKKYSQGTWYNYAPMLYTYGFATHKNGKNGKFLKIILTDKGKQVLAQTPQKRPTKKPISKKNQKHTTLTPQTLQSYVDEYNQQNPSWPFELAPKGFRKEIQSTN
jgi:hypothetical protein